MEDQTRVYISEVDIPVIIHSYNSQRIRLHRQRMWNVIALENARRKVEEEQITDEQPKMMPEKSDTQDVPKFGTHKESMIRITEEEYRQLESGKPYIIISRMVSVGERLLLQVFQNGRTTGILLEAKVCWTDTMQTSSGVAKGYTVAVVKWRQI